MEVGGRAALDQLAEAVARMLGVPIAMISRFDGTVQHVPGAHGLTGALAATRATRSANPLCLRVQLTGKPVIVHDARQRHAPGDDTLESLGVVAYAGFPLIGERGATHGVLAAIDHHVHRWLDRDIAVLRAFAASATALIALHGEREHVAALERTLAREIADRALLVRVAHVIQTAPSSSDAVRTVLGELIGYLGAPAAELSAGDFVRVVAPPTGRDPPPPWVIEDDPQVAEVVHTGAPAFGALPAPDGDRLGVVVPLPGERASPALLRVVVPAAGSDPVRIGDVLGGVSALLGVIVDHDRDDGLRARRTAELEVLSLHDELTGLLNRRGFHAVAEGQLALARRQAMSGLVMFLDLDGLKSTNDRAGHAAGDELLCAAAAVLRSTFRGADTVGRLGGDEFVVFSVDATELDLAGIRARLGAEVERLNLARGGGQPLVWSMGVVAFAAAEAVSLSRLVAEADRRMYEAKRGRI